MRAFAIALLAAALLAFTPLKVAFCARAGERTGAALGVFLHACGGDEARKEKGAYSRDPFGPSGLLFFSCACFSSRRTE